MVAYSFQKQFAEPILSGQKLQTIRAVRKRHARPGEKLQLFTGMRTRYCKKIAEKTCAAAIPVVINFNDGGSVYVGESYRFRSFVPNFETDLIIPEAPGVRLIFAEKEDFARRDGFESWNHLAEFWAQHHGVPDRNNPFIGVLIGWWPE